MKHAPQQNSLVTGRRVVWSAAAILALLHQDFWLWDNQNLLWGYLPSGLAYHMLFSVAVAGLWASALKFAWPSDWERWAEEPPPEPAAAPPPQA